MNAEKYRMQNMYELSESTGMSLLSALKSAVVPQTEVQQYIVLPFENWGTRYRVISKYSLKIKEEIETLNKLIKRRLERFQR